MSDVLLGNKINGSWGTVNTGQSYVVDADIILSNNVGVYCGNALDSTTTYNNSFRVEAKLVAKYEALQLFGSGYKVNVTGTGIVRSDDYAITLSGLNNYIENHGAVIGGSAGVFIYCESTAVADNYADISSTNGVSVFVNAGTDGSVTIHNHLNANLYQGISTGGQQGSEITLRNEGSIGPSAGGFNAFSGQTGIDRIYNTGVIVGRLMLYDGNDVLDNRGGTIGGVVYGGKGDDSYYLDSPVRISESSGEGTDTIFSQISFDLGSDQYQGQEIENVVLQGVGNLNVAGNELKNTLTGNAGDNLLDGGAEADNLIGGDGNDIYVVDNAGDTIVEGAGAQSGKDTVKAKIDYMLAEGSNLENLVLLGSVKVGTGNSSDNTLVGNEAANVLTGKDGNDVLDGGDGIDKMQGGAGNDTYIVSEAGDVVDETGGGGIDTVRAGFTYSIAALGLIENITLTGSGNYNGKGNGLANTLAGNAGKNVLDGGLGIDTLMGGRGDDTYIVNDSRDKVSEANNGGVDTVKASATFALSTFVEKLVLTGKTNINGTGNGLDNAMNGNSGKNTLNGGAGKDTLVGGAGDDLLIGGTGNDILTGGGDRDTFRFTGHFNRDKITDFTIGKDHIDVRSISAIASFKDLVNNHMSEKNGDVIIKVGSDWITIENHHKADFHAGDFMI